MRCATGGRALCAATLFLSACALSTLRPLPAPGPTTVPPRLLIVFAAASLTDAFTEMGQAFEAAHPGVTVVFNFDASQSLRIQLQEGASADVFAAASQREMDSAAVAALVAGGTPHVFLYNELIVILPAGNPGRVQTLADLARPGLKLVLAAEEVPAGGYSREALDKMEAQFGVGFRDKVLANVVSNEENVRQVVAKVQLGEADAGMAYGSDAMASPELETLAIPPDFNVIAEYPIAALAHAPQPDLAAAFVAYVLSSEGQATLKKWGFTPAGP